MIHGIPRSVEVEGMPFPGRDDYLGHYGVEASESGELNLDQEQVVAIQRDWHSRGQNGCVFAMHAARNYSPHQWSMSVHDELPESSEMRALIEGAVEDADNQLHSLIFPNITTTEQVYELVGRAVEAGCTIQTEEKGQTDVMRLRWALGDIESWVIGFAPVPDVPATRQAPFAELVFRTKTKTKMIHPDLNNDPTQAHVADLDLGFDTETVGRLMEKSSDRTERLLGGTAARSVTHGAKAKTTYGINLGQEIMYDADTSENSLAYEQE